MKVNNLITKRVVVLSLWIMTLGVISCQNTSRKDPNQLSIAGASTTQTGIEYKFYTKNNTSRKTQQGDRISFNLLVQNATDSILSNQYFKELPFENDFFIGKEYFKDIFQMVSEGDSLSFWIPADSLFNKSGYLKTPKIPEGSKIKYTLKVESIQTLTDIKNKLKANLRAQREIDEERIEKYITDLQRTNPVQKFEKTNSGLRYHLLKEGLGKTPKQGDTVLVNYTSRILEGKVYDYTEEDTEYLVGDALPHGFDESLTLLKEGGKGIFILPSDMGFGPKGMGSVVPSNAILLFDIELIRVK